MSSNKIRKREIQSLRSKRREKNHNLATNEKSLNEATHLLFTSLKNNGQLIEHPKYGDSIISSGVEIVGNYNARSNWKYSSEPYVFPESAIEADYHSQNTPVFVKYYIDVLKECQDCHKWFIFFAKEQQRWYDELKIYIGVNCTRCVPCRKLHRGPRIASGIFSQLIIAENLSLLESLKLAKSAAYLFDRNLIKKDATIRKVIQKLKPFAEQNDDISNAMKKLREKKS